MIFTPLSLIGFLLTLLSLLGIRLCAMKGKLIALFLLYPGGCCLLLPYFSKQSLAALLITGISNCVLLATGHSLWREPFFESRSKSAALFHCTMALLLGIMVYGIGQRITLWLPIPGMLMFTALFTLSMAITDMIFDRPLLVEFIDLQCVLFSFELVYIPLEKSTLVFGALILISLLISFIGAFLTVPEPQPQAENTEDLL